MASTVSKEYTNGDGYFQIHFLMIRAHETLLLGLESVTRQADQDHSNDVYNWLGYVSAWAECVHHHHTLEEKHLFPLMKSRGLDVETEIEQHAKLHLDLESLSSKLKEWKANPASYSGIDLKPLLEELAPNFKKHLQEEVEHLSRNRLVDHITSQELKECIAKLEEDAKKGDPFVAPVFMMSHTPPQHKYWSNMGWFMYKVLIPALSYRHSGYWKYAPEPLN